jgi:hypothetical protein
MRIQSGNAINSQQPTNNSLIGGFQRTQTNFTTGTTNGKMWFLNFAEYVRSGGTFLDVAPVHQLANESNSTTATIAIEFPGYFSSVFYDPDFGVLVAPQGTSSSGFIALQSHLRSPSHQSVFINIQGMEDPILD